MEKPRGKVKSTRNFAVASAVENFVDAQEELANKFRTTQSLVVDRTLYAAIFSGDK